MPIVRVASSSTQNNPITKTKGQQAKFQQKKKKQWMQKEGKSILGVNNKIYIYNRVSKDRSWFFEEKMKFRQN